MTYSLPLTTPDGAEAFALAVPTQWADVTLAQFVTLCAPAAQEARTAAEILCGLAAGTLENLAVRDVAYLTTLLTFAADPAPVLELLPTPGLPDVGTLPYGTLLLAQQHLSAHADQPPLFHFPHLLALYRVQLAFGKYDAARVAACEAALRACA